MDFADYSTGLPRSDPYRPWQPFEGLPGGMPTQMLGLLLAQQMRQHGFTPLGFNQSGNLYNNLSQQAFDLSHRQLLAPLQQSAEQQLMQVWQGAASMFGRRVGPAEDAAMRNLTSGLLRAAPIDPFAMEMLENLTGVQNPYALHSRMHRAGRFGIDPVTGFGGISSATTQQVAAGVSDYFYGTPERMAARGRHLNIGAAYEELAYRGLMPGPGNLRERVTGGLDQLDAATRMRVFSDTGIDTMGSRLSEANIDALAQNADVQMGMRDQTKTRVIDTLKKYTGALDAVREIFGDAGNPNAPMPQLFEMLENLTMGSLQQLDGGRAEMLVRNLTNSARDAGVGIGGVFQLLQAGGVQAQQLGINPLFATQSTMFGLQTMQSLQQTGVLANAQGTWGLADINQLTAMAQAQYSRAAASPAVNRLSMIARLNQRLGVTGGGLFGDVVQQIETGELSPELAERMARMSTNAFLAEIASNTDLSLNDVEKAHDAKSLNEEFGFKGGLAGMGTQMQAIEFRDRILGGQEGGAFNTRAQRFLFQQLGGVDRGLALDISANLAKNVQQLAGEGVTQLEKQIPIVARRLREQLMSSGDGRELLSTLGGSEEEQLFKLRIFAEGAYGAAEMEGRKWGLIPKDQKLANFMVSSGLAADSRGQIEVGTSLRSQFQAATGGRLDPSFIRRALDAISKESGRNDPGALRRVMGEIAGLAESDELLNDLTPLMQELLRVDEDIAKEQKSLEGKVGKGTATSADITRLNALKRQKAATEQEFTRFSEALQALGIQPPGPEGATPGATDTTQTGPQTIEVASATVHFNGTPVFQGAGTVALSGTSRGMPPNAGVA